ncbi:urease accessory protein UreD [Enteractinococcus helveticum]|uniref:Urease accessory protein UreD n=1 Tax=Enteractinococcus helveticum TaxID=1837282 RepID=A0A1B7M192_9MICC|nr:urease accessory protein UreD [Enteractinococcus helveticum]OAV62363.1 urease accessory protein UreD [Enteractinococcus helveticum]
MTPKLSLDNPVGQLRMVIEERAGRAIARQQYFQGALRVLRPHYLDDSGQVSYTIVNPGGGYLGGDVYAIDIEVSRGTSASLTSQSATKVYKTPDEPAYQHTVFRLGTDAVLEYVPDQLIAYRDAHYLQDTVVEMEPSASYLSTEIVTPGWAPDGTLFKYDRLHLRHEVRISGRPMIVDNLIVRPDDETSPIESMLYMDGRTHLGSLLAVDARIDAELVAALREKITCALDDVGTMTPANQPNRVIPEPLFGITLLDGPGLAVRVLGTSTEQITAALYAVVNDLRARWRDQGPIHLRKY